MTVLLAFFHTRLTRLLWKTTDVARPNYLALVGQNAKVNRTSVRWRGCGQ